MATAATQTIAEVENLVEPGEIAPEDVHNLSDLREETRQSGTTQV